MPNLVEQLTAAIGTFLNGTAPEASALHVCTASCASPCLNIGKVSTWDAVTVPTDHVLLGVVAQQNGGRITTDIPVAAFASALSAHDPATALTYASATAALTVKTLAGQETGLQPYLDQWHADGVLP